MNTTNLGRQHSGFDFRTFSFFMNLGCQGGLTALATPKFLETCKER